VRHRFKNTIRGGHKKAALEIFIPEYPASQTEDSSDPRYMCESLAALAAAQIQADTTHQ
jgi:hypothetical protein